MGLALTAPYNMIFLAPQQLVINWFASKGCTGNVTEMILQYFQNYDPNPLNGSTHQVGYVEGANDEVMVDLLISQYFIPRGVYNGYSPSYYDFRFLFFHSIMMMADDVPEVDAETAFFSDFSKDFILLS